MSKMPMPGYFLAVLNKSQFENVDFQGDDKFDLPNSGIMKVLTAEDLNKSFKRGASYGTLLGKKVYWAKYAEADAFFHDEEIGENVVFISLDKLRGYEE